MTVSQVEQLLGTPIKILDWSKSNPGCEERRYNGDGVNVLFIKYQDGKVKYIGENARFKKHLPVG